VFLNRPKVTTIGPPDLESPSKTVHDYTRNIHIRSYSICHENIPLYTLGCASQFCTLLLQPIAIQGNSQSTLQRGYVDWCSYTWDFPSNLQDHYTHGPQTHLFTLLLCLLHDPHSTVQVQLKLNLKSTSPPPRSPVRQVCSANWIRPF
jgi:hypothetical protein